MKKWYELHVFLYFYRLRMSVFDFSFLSFMFISCVLVRHLVRKLSQCHVPKYSQKTHQSLLVRVSYMVGLWTTRTRSNSYPRQVVPRTTRTQDNPCRGRLLTRTTRTQDKSYPGQLVPETTRIQDDSYPWQLVPRIKFIQNNPNFSG